MRIVSHTYCLTSVPSCLLDFTLNAIKQPSYFFFGRDSLLYKFVKPYLIDIRKLIKNNTVFDNFILKIE